MLTKFGSGFQCCENAVKTAYLPIISLIPEYKEMIPHY